MMEITLRKKPLRYRILDRLPLPNFTYYFTYEKGYWERYYPCWKCKRITKHLRCDNCNKFFCLTHCDWDNDSDYESPGQPDYPVCYRCLEDYEQI